MLHPNQDGALAGKMGKEEWRVNFDRPLIYTVQLAVVEMNTDMLPACVDYWDIYMSY